MIAVYPFHRSCTGDESEPLLKRSKTGSLQEPLVPNFNFLQQNANLAYSSKASFDSNLLVREYPNTENPSFFSDYSHSNTSYRVREREEISDTSMFHLKKLKKHHPENPLVNTRKRDITVFNNEFHSESSKKERLIGDTLSNGIVCFEDNIRELGFLCGGDEEYISPSGCELVFL